MSMRREKAGRLSRDKALWGYLTPGPGAERPADLDLVLPAQLGRRAVGSAGPELIFPYAETLEAIDAATQHGIAVLGVESFEIRGDGALLPLSFTAYEFPPDPDWGTFVGQNNHTAERWVKDHRLDENHGYILTSASQKEFSSLKARGSP